MPAGVGYPDPTRGSGQVRISDANRLQSGGPQVPVGGAPDIMDLLGQGQGAPPIPSPTQGVPAPVAPPSPDLPSSGGGVDPNVLDGLEGQNPLQEAPIEEAPVNPEVEQVFQAAMSGDPQAAEIMKLALDAIMQQTSGQEEQALPDNPIV